MSSTSEPRSERVLVVIPCYNEAPNIGAVLDEIEQLNARGVDCEVLVIDDGSSDDTLSKACGKARCVRLPVNLGIGGAVQTGVRYAHEHGFDLCLQLDGDGQHPADQAPLFLAEHRRSPSNLLIGSRFLAAGGFQSSSIRRLGIALVRRCIQILYGVRVTDPTSGFRLLDREAIRLFAEEYPTDFPEPISIAVALNRGLVVREIPVRMRARVAGESSIRGLKTAIYILRVVGYLFLVRANRSW